MSSIVSMLPVDLNLLLQLVYGPVRDVLAAVLEPAANAPQDISKKLIDIRNNMISGTGFTLCVQSVVVNNGIGGKHALIICIVVTVIYAEPAAGCVSAVFVEIMQTFVNGDKCIQSNTAVGLTVGHCLTLGCPIGGNSLAIRAEVIGIG